MGLFTFAKEGGNWRFSSKDFWPRLCILLAEAWWSSVNTKKIPRLWEFSIYRLGIARRYREHKWTLANISPWCCWRHLVGNTDLCHQKVRWRHTLPYHPEQAEQGKKSAAMDGQKGELALGRVEQERCSPSACQRHRCQTQRFCWYPYNKRLPLPSMFWSYVVCTLSSYSAKSYVNNPTSFNVIDNPINVTCGHFALVTNGPVWKMIESLCRGGRGLLTWLVVELPSDTHIDMVSYIF